MSHDLEATKGSVCCWANKFKLRILKYLNDSLFIPRENCLKIYQLTTDTKLIFCHLTDITQNMYLSSPSNNCHIGTWNQICQKKRLICYKRQIKIRELYDGDGRESITKNVNWFSFKLLSYSILFNLSIMLAIKIVREFYKTVSKYRKSNIKYLLLLKWKSSILCCSSASRGFSGIQQAFSTDT